MMKRVFAGVLAGILLCHQPVVAQATPVIPPAQLRPSSSSEAAVGIELTGLALMLLASAKNLNGEFAGSTAGGVGYVAQILGTGVGLAGVADGLARQDLPQAGLGVLGAVAPFLLSIAYLEYCDRSAKCSPSLI